MSALALEPAPLRFAFTFWPGGARRPGEAREQLLSFGELAERWRDPSEFLGKDEHSGFSTSRFRGKRSKSNVIESSCVGLDFDGSERWENALALWPGVLGLAHTTKSHTAAIHRFRMIIALSRPVTPDEFSIIWNALQLQSGGKLDPACCDASRFWFSPSKTPDFRLELLEGEPLEVERLLEQARAVPSRASASPAASRRDTGDRYARAALERGFDAVANAPQGSRNDTLNRQGYGLGGFVGSGLLDRGEVEFTLTRAARSAGLDEAEIRASIRSSVEAGMSRPRIVPEPLWGAQGGAGAATDAVPVALPARWLSDIGDLSASPPPHTWLLSDIRTSQPVIRAGKVIVLAADGGVGKSFFWLQLAVSIALGWPLFGVFKPEREGPVALLMAEDDEEECLDRVHRICNALGLNASERASVAKRILLFGLAGHDVALMRSDASRNAVRSPALDNIVERLVSEAKKSNFEWSFIGLDPLARFAAGGAESDNEAATAFVAALESIALRVPGQPTIGCTHHSSKASLRAGGADVRGVTGIRNAFRAAFTLTKAEAGPLRGVLLENVKNNLAPEASPVWLVRLGNEPTANGRWIETGGVLRLATDDEAIRLASASGRSPSASREHRNEAKRERVREQLSGDCEALLSVLPVEPAHASREQLRAALKAQGESWGQARLEQALEVLVARDLVRDLSGGGRSRPRQWAKRDSVTSRDSESRGDVSRGLEPQAGGP